jgi:hypothetical protein
LGFDSFSLKQGVKFLVGAWTGSQAPALNRITTAPSRRRQLFYVQNAGTVSKSCRLLAVGFELEPALIDES